MNRPVIDSRGQPAATHPDASAGARGSWRRRLSLLVLLALGAAGGILFHGWVFPSPQYRGLTPTGWRDAWQADADECNKAFLDPANTNLAFLAAALRTPPSLADRGFAVIHRGGQLLLGVLPLRFIVRFPMPANRHLEVQSRALARLEQMGAAASPVLPVLMDLLEDRNAFIRAKALRVIGNQGEAARPAVPALIRLTDDGDPWTRGAALAQLQRLDPGQPEVRETAMKRLKDPSLMIRIQAAELLWATDRRAGPLLPAMAEILKKGNGPERVRALIFIGEFGEAAAPMVPTLVSLLAARDPQVRMVAVVTLGKLGAMGAEALPALEALRDQAEPQLRLRTQRSIQAIRGRSPAYEQPAR